MRNTLPRCGSWRGLRHEQPCPLRPLSALRTRQRRVVLLGVGHFTSPSRRARVRALRSGGLREGSPGGLWRVPPVNPLPFPPLPFNRMFDPPFVNSPPLPFNRGFKPPSTPPFCQLSPPPFNRVFQPPFEPPPPLSPSPPPPFKGSFDPPFKPLPLSKGCFNPPLTPPFQQGV